MLRKDNHLIFSDLRQQYPYFVYEDYVVSQNHHQVKIEFSFNLSDKIRFNPSLIIPVKSFFLTDTIDTPLFNSIAFHIGMAELVSYWKATCSPKIIIRPFHFDAFQVSFWKKLLYQGLGEFFYMNSIVTDPESLLSITTTGIHTDPSPGPALDEGLIIPVGGGKDSCVTLSLLRDIPSRPFILNPRKASRDTIQRTGFTDEDAIEFYRDIHPQLLSLNVRGFLNGHTPFSALLAFQSLLASLLTGFRHIALSNESSANEATIPHTHINHQYSKTFEFEKDFREYVMRHITCDMNYFSLLRPLNELQIAWLFSGKPQFFDVFRSCNEGSKTDTWCGRCAKCLFTYVILSPFISGVELERIFGHNLLDDITLKKTFDQLTGDSEEKPFECVGTIQEVNAALRMVLRSQSADSIPSLLRYYISNHDMHAGIDDDKKLLTFINPSNFVPPELLGRIKKALYDQPIN